MSRPPIRRSTRPVGTADAPAPWVMRITKNEITNGRKHGTEISDNP